MTRLSIVIGTYNRLPILKKCLSAIIGKIAVDHEIIVIDAGSTDQTISYLKKVTPSITLVEDGQRKGQAQSLNQVIVQANSQYTCWLSDDNVVRENAIDQAVAILNQQPKIGMLALKTRDVDYPEWPNVQYIGGIWPPGILNCNQGLIRTQLFQKLNGFDETFQDYGIDIDLTVRVLLTGYQVAYTKHLCIDHFRDDQSLSWIEPKERIDRMQKAKQYYQKKYAALLRIQKSFSQTQTKLNHLLINAIKKGYQKARSMQKPIETWMGYNERDWYNVINTCCISKLDLLKNKDKPYYLVQSL